MMYARRQLTFRPSAEPGIASPVTVRSTGHYRLAGGMEHNAPRAFSQIFWVAAGSVRYRRGGQEYNCCASQGFFFRALEPHWVEDSAQDGEYYWATFDGAAVGDWLQANGCGPQPRPIGPCPRSLFAELRLRIAESSLQAEIQAAELGLRLLIRFAATHNDPSNADNSTDARLCERIDALMLAHFSDPEFGIDQIARRLACHRATLYRAYRKQRGMPPSAFLQRLRVQRGLELLHASTVPIADIAPAAGFRDPNYFAKVIRAATAQSPRSLRRSFTSTRSSTRS